MVLTPTGCDFQALLAIHVAACMRSALCFSSNAQADPTRETILTLIIADSEYGRPATGMNLLLAAR